MARAPSFSASAISAATMAREAGSLVRASGETSREGLLGRGDISRERPLLGAQEFIVVALRRRFGREIRIDARGIGVLALRRQLLRTLLILNGARYRLDQAAAGGEQRGGECRPEHRPWTSEDHCHTLHYNDNRKAGRLYVVATPIGNLGDLAPRAREVLSECALDRRGRHSAYGRPAAAFRHSNPDAVAARSQ